MESNNNKTGYTNPQLNEFLDTKIDAKTLAKILRRVNYILALTIIRNKEDDNPINEQWADDGYYYINELAEILHPVLESED